MRSVCGVFISIYFYTSFRFRSSSSTVHVYTFVPGPAWPLFDRVDMGKQAHISLETYLLKAEKKLT